MNTITLTLKNLQNPISKGLYKIEKTTKFQKTIKGFTVIGKAKNIKGEYETVKFNIEN